MNKRYLTILRELLSLPTAPFHEDAVIAWLRQWAKSRGLPIRSDKAGNLLVTLAATRGRAHDTGQTPVLRGRPHWVFAAHMDHPGFVVESQRGRSVQARFLGHVGRQYFVGSRVRLLTAAGEVPAVVRSARPVPDTPWFACRLALAAGGPPRSGMGVSPMRPTGILPVEIPPGTLGTWDFPAVQFAGRRVRARGCDDVAGVAAMVAAIEQIARRKPHARVTALFTRAEETGLVGAMEACRLGSIPKNALVVALETSKAMPTADLGGGVVLRVGDRVMSWDNRLMMHLSAVAARLARRDKRFLHTRQLMPGGVCESSAYHAEGYRATGLCVPLGNYHNQGPAGRPAPEEIDLGDFESIVKLLTALAADTTHPDSAARAFTKRLRHMLATRRKYLY